LLGGPCGSSGGLRGSLGGPWGVRGGPWGVLGVLGGPSGGSGGGAPSLWEASGGPQGSDTKFVGRRRGPVFDPDPPKINQKTIGNMCVSAT
jgi:hypothetical protein